MDFPTTGTRRLRGLQARKANSHSKERTDSPPPRKRKATNNRTKYTSQRASTSLGNAARVLSPPPTRLPDHQVPAPAACAVTRRCLLVLFAGRRAPALGGRLRGPNSCISLLRSASGAMAPFAAPARPRPRPREATSPESVPSRHGADGNRLRAQSASERLWPKR